MTFNMMNGWTSFSTYLFQETYPAFHYTSLLYMADYKRDFTGGRFVFIDEHQRANRTVEPREGRVSAFTSGIENKHHVEPVTGGSRCGEHNTRNYELCKYQRQPFSGSLKLCHISND